jgi:AraC-like DNA-binding protein
MRYVNGYISYKNCHFFILIAKNRYFLIKYLPSLLTERQFLFYNSLTMEWKTRYLLSNDHIENPLRFGDVQLLQLGRRYCEATEEIIPHPHLNWFELTIVTDGRGTVFTNGESCEVHSGDIYLSFPCDIHEIRADLNSKLEYDFLSFYCENPLLKRDLKGITQAYFGAKSRVFQDDKICSLVQQAIAEFSVKGQPYSEELLSDIFRLICVYLLRNFSDSKQKVDSVSDAQILCLQIMNYIDTHVYSLQYLQELAPRFNYNYGYLSGLFKKTTGKSLLDYFHHRKMETAKALILENKKKIKEIAEMLHYSPYAFSKAFKAKYGVSPKALQMRR